MEHGLKRMLLHLRLATAGIVSVWLLSGCESHLTVLGSFQEKTVFDFPLVSLPSLKENETAQSEALRCTRSENTALPGKFRIDKVSDTDVGCALQETDKTVLVCSPKEKTGLQNWTSEVAICCDIGKKSSCQTSTINVYDTKYDIATLSLNSVVAVDPPAIYRFNDVITLAMHFPTHVVLEGSPNLRLRLNSGTRLASYVSGSGTSDLLFQYKVQGDDDSQKMDYDGPLAYEANGSTLTNESGASVDTRLPSPGSSGSIGAATTLIIDTMAPEPAQSVGFAYGFSGGSLIAVSWANGTDANFKTHHVKLCLVSDCVTGCLNEAVIEKSPTSLSAPGGTYHACVQSEDAVGLYSAWVPSILTSTIDTTRPTAIDVTSPTADGYHKAGDVIALHVRFTKPVFPGPFSSIKLRLATGHDAIYASTTAGTTLVFNYTVQPGDTTSDLDYLNAQALTLGASGDLEDIFGNDAILELPAPAALNSLSNRNAIVLDTTSPTPPSSLAQTDILAIPGPRTQVSFTPGTDTNARFHRTKACLNTSCTSSCTTPSTSLVTPADVTGLSAGLDYYLCVQEEDLAGNVSTWASTPTSSRTLAQAVKKLAQSTVFSFHNCVIIQDDSVRCWGKNERGQLGNGNTRSIPVPSDVPVNFGAGKYAVDLTIGGDHSCALLNDSTIRCWGLNEFGQLGYGDTSQRNVPDPSPIYLGMGRTAKKIFSGPNSTCALLDNDSVKCWGRNTDYILGNGTDANVYAPPTLPLDLGAARTNNVPPIVVRDLKMTWAHTCALLSDQTVTCWGWSNDGRAGTNGIITAPQNTSINFGGTAVESFVIYGEGGCAILIDTTTRCWGTNYYGNLGLGTEGAGSPTPAAAINFGAGLYAKSLYGSDRHVCAILNDGSVKCWGSNFQGQTGYVRPLKIKAPPPTPIDLGVGRTALSVQGNGTGTCALLDNFSVKCWGGDQYGRNGRGKDSATYGPMNAAAPITGILSDLKLSYWHACGLFTDNSLKCWGEGEYGRIGDGDYLSRVLMDQPATIDLGVGLYAVKMALGDLHTCVILNGVSGLVKCWGYNGDGRLGYGDYITRTTPDAATLAMPGGLAATKIYLNWTHTCAILSDGTVACWGPNDLGQGGNGTAPLTQPYPRLASLGGNTAKSLALGKDFTCAIIQDDTVRCWGSNSDGQLGTSNYTNLDVPPNTSIALGTTATAILAGESHACAILTGGAMKCWGSNFDGRLGYGDALAPLQPRVGTLNFGVGKTVTKAYTLLGHTCAVLNDATLKCWGSSYAGQTGDHRPGYYWAPPTVPIYFGPGRTVIAAATGDYQTCAILDDNTVRCFGEARTAKIGSPADNVAFTPPTVPINFWNPLRILYFESDAPGLFAPSDEIRFRLVFSRPVRLTNPTDITLTLETGSIKRNAVYYSGDLTDAITFRYIVQNGDTSDRLDALSASALSLGAAGTIQDLNGNDFSLALPALGTIDSLEKRSFFRLIP